MIPAAILKLPPGWSLYFHFSEELGQYNHLISVKEGYEAHFNFYFNGIFPENSKRDLNDAFSTMLKIYLGSIEVQEKPIVVVGTEVDKNELIIALSDHSWIGLISRRLEQLGASFLSIH